MEKIEYQYRFWYRYRPKFMVSDWYRIEPQKAGIAHHYFIAQKNLKRRYPVNLRALIRKLGTRPPGNARTIAACMSAFSISY